ncbi:PilZ domain-containing protein [Myxococcota bacterium]|nr:PilZ domain-containing protein [Myxococcota bacterium]
MALSTPPAGPAEHASQTHAEFDDDDGGGRLGPLTGARRISATLPLFQRGDARLLCDGMRKPIVVEVRGSQATMPQTGRATEILIVRPTEGELTISPWVGGGFASLWASDELGLIAFRVPCLGAASGALVLAMPEYAVRWSRRAEPRYLAPADGAGLVAVHIMSGGAWTPARLVNLSVSGVQIEVPSSVPAEVGTAVTLSLQVGSPRALEVSAEVRHGDPLANGQRRLGLVFVDIGRLDRLVLERFLSRHAAETVVDRHVAQTLPRPVATALAQPQAEVHYPLPSPETLPLTVLLQARPTRPGH